ncbi:sugar porter family MFS transporter [Actinomycetospora sp. NBRC 106378]|jgi:MFS transporter, SP family, sugar:H+ symporter|uniref:sugar porter family MFS transporter n=1 Tax=Actinomycetospora sp. NBRC 106378 TaxID=3032208 RepID=UPI0024A3DC24|nr:sugar porter family MFS transporter [Actinomycetospora sp. NBRC 106378]GLZ53209.1 MFS transporter [Actinomycetospora sp. NBRC 106378]
MTTDSPAGPGGSSVSGTAPKTTTKAILVSIVAAVGGFLFGFDSSVINGAVDALNNQFGLTNSPLLAGFTVACALLGSAVGAWFAGPVADRYGRVRVMLIAAALFAISSIGSGLAFAVWDLIIWRILAGVGIGIASVIAPAYIAEIAPAHIRGRLGSLQQMAIVLGIFVALLSDALLAGVAGGAANEFWLGLEAWRWMFIVGIIPSAIYAVLALRIPESPRYLVAKGRLEEAGQVLHSVEESRSMDSVQRKVTEIADSLRRDVKPSLRDLTGQRFGLKPIVWVGILLSVFQQFVGINVIFYYSTTLWQAVGFSESQSFLASVINGLINVLSTIVAILIVDRVGRRPMLLAGSLGMTVTLLVMAISFSQAVPSVSESGESTVALPGAWGPIALVAANLFVVSFAITWGPVVWVLLGEMFPNYLRAAALAVAAAAQWLANFLITVTFQSLADVGLTLAYGLYTLFALLSFVFVYKAVAETKGKELEEMVA